MRWISSKKSFSLVELLITIGIIGTLTALGVIFLNPVEHLREGRDAQRISDLQTLHSVIQKYKYSGKRIGSLGSVQTIYTSLVDTTSTCANLGLGSLADGWAYHCATSSASLQKVDGNGWLPINFGSNSDIAVLPIDPTNSTSSYYSYIVSSAGGYFLGASLESVKYLSQYATKDGGQSTVLYEKGEDLDLFSQSLY